jgi:hypothetical protein
MKATVALENINSNATYIWKSQMNSIVRIALVGYWAVIAAPGTGAQTYDGTQTVQYLQSFLDQTPDDAELARLPPGAQDVTVAKVRVLAGPFYLIGRDQSGAPPPLPKDLFAARVEVLEVLKGKTTIGAVLHPSFGVPGPGRRYKFPHTPLQKERSYFIVSYVDDDRVRRLLAFTVSEQEYAVWEEEFFEYERSRGRPGARDR